MFDILQFLVPLAVAAIAFFINAAGKKAEMKRIQDGRSPQ